MLIIDASCLAEVLLTGPREDAVREVMATDTNWAAPHCVDAEVLGVIRKHWLAGTSDDTSAALAVRDLSEWSGSKIPHGPLLEPAWQMRGNIRSWDALYVALAIMTRSPLVTMDARLAEAAPCEGLVP